MKRKDEPFILRKLKLQIAVLRDVLPSSKCLDWDMDRSWSVSSGAVFEFAAWRVVGSARSKMLQLSVLAGESCHGFGSEGDVLDFHRTMPGLRIVIMML